MNRREHGDADQDRPDADADPRLRERPLQPRLRLAGLRRACGGRRAHSVQEDRRRRLRATVLRRLRIEIALTEHLTHDRVVDEQADEEARAEGGIDRPERALPDAALDVAGQELAQAADPLLVERLRQLVAFERGVEEQADEGRIGVHAREQHAQQAA